MLEISEKALNSLIAAYIVADSCRNTTTGVWSFGFDEIDKKFELPIGYTKEHKFDIMNQLESYDQLAGFSCLLGERFNLDIYLDYCSVTDEGR